MDQVAQGRKGNTRGEVSRVRTGYGKPTITEVATVGAVGFSEAPLVKNLPGIGVEENRSARPVGLVMNPNLAHVARNVRSAQCDRFGSFNGVRNEAEQAEGNGACVLRGNVRRNNNIRGESRWIGANRGVADNHICSPGNKALVTDKKSGLEGLAGAFQSGPAQDVLGGEFFANLIERNRQAYGAVVITALGLSRHGAKDDRV